MPKYAYRGLSTEGKTQTGSVTAGSEEEAVALVEKKGLSLLSISQTKEIVIFNKGATVKSDHLVAFTRQFATIVKAGVPILEGLSILAEQTESPALKVVLKSMAKDIEGGSSLSQALEKHPAIFSEIYVNTVVAGEAGGVLDKVLERLSLVMERDAAIASEVQAALRYPFMTLIAIAGAVLFLVTFVVPKFASIYSRLGGALPLPTKVLMMTSTAVIKGWYILFPALGFLFFLFHRYINTKRGRWQWDSIKLKVPVFGALFLKMYMLRFASMLSVLYESGLPILRTLEIVGSTVGNVVLTREVEVMRRSVAEGKGVAGAILESKVFPPLVSHMVSIGEKTGAFAEMLNFVGDYYELELKSMVKNLTSMIEPIMTAVMGAVVLVMALAIFLPMWNMISVFKQNA